MAHQTLHIQRWWGAWFTKPYNYIGLISHGSPSVTHKMLWGRIAHQTLQIHFFEYPCLTQRYVYKGLRAQDSPNLTNIHVLRSLLVLYSFHIFQIVLTFVVFPAFRFSMFSMLSMFSINGVPCSCGRCALNGVP